MPWVTHGWHKDVAAEETHETGDAAHRRASVRAQAAQRQVAVFHETTLNNGRARRTKAAVYDRYGAVRLGSAAWRPLEERGDIPMRVDVGGLRVGRFDREAP